MADAVVRETVLVQQIPRLPTSSVEVRRITLQPGVQGGRHRHNGPVFGSIERGSVVFQVDGFPARRLSAGDVFYEPADETIARWDATDDGVTFLGYFLLGDGQAPELTPLD